MTTEQLTFSLNGETPWLSELELAALRWRHRHATALLRRGELDAAERQSLLVAVVAPSAEFLAISLAAVREAEAA